MSKLGKKLISAMKDGQTYHEFNCPCDFCKAGDTRHPMKCQATFKKHCQYPKCDCDRPVTAAVINSTEFPRYKRLMDDPKFRCDCGANAAYTAKMYPDNGDFHVTDPHHGGKVTCHKCNGFIMEKDNEPYWEYPDKKKILAHFHKNCYNGYEHYYGLDRPID